MIAKIHGPVIEGAVIVDVKKYADGYHVFMKLPAMTGEEIAISEQYDFQDFLERLEINKTIAECDAIQAQWKGDADSGLHL